MKKISKSLIFILVLLLSLSLMIIGCQQKEASRYARPVKQENVGYTPKGNMNPDVPFVDTDRYADKYGVRPQGYRGQNYQGPYTTNRYTDEYKQNLGTTLANRTQKIYNKVTALSGINDSTVVITGNTALVGVDIGKNTQGNITDELKRKVESTVRNTDKNINNVVVTADTDLYQRIRKVGNDINNGKPLSGFGNEIQEIIRRITPR